MITITTDDNRKYYADKIEKGLAWLDGFVPGWESRINLDTLNIDDPHRCIAGQVFAANAEADGYHSGYSWAQAEADGFDCCRMGMCSYSPLMNGLWRDVITARREATPNADDND